MKTLIPILCILIFVGALLCGARASELPVKMDAVTTLSFGMNLPLPALTTAPAFSFQDPQPEPRTIGVAGYYSFCSKVPAAIVMSRVGGIDRFLGLRFSPDVSAFTGGDIDGIIRAGGCVTGTLPLGTNLSLIGGLGFDFPLQDFDFKKVGVGVVLGFRYDVRF